MKVKSPKENVYYYECGDGQFRLFYFIPPEELKKLKLDKRISSKAIDDFPDGVDLGCTETDFKEFEDSYGYRVPLDPDALRQAFYAILSTTRNWKKFRGSGFIPAVDLENHTEKIDHLLPREKPSREGVEPKPKRAPLKHFRRSRRKMAASRSQTQARLRRYQPEGIDPKRTLQQQKFSRIRWSDGAGAEDVFMSVHQKQGKKEA